MSLKKPLDKMTNEENLAEWTRRARAFLVGKRIVDVRYHTEKENDEIYYDDYGRNVRIIFDDGHWITPSQDDEGNGHGVLFTTDKEHGVEVIPSIGYHN